MSISGIYYFAAMNFNPNPTVGVGEPVPFCRADGKRRPTQSNPFSLDECPYDYSFGQRISFSFGYREEKYMLQPRIVAFTGFPGVYPWERLRMVAM